MTSCALPGCNKPTSGTHLACGEHHHFLLMDSRYSSCRPKQSLISQIIISPHLCAFSPCKEPPSPGHICCSKRHYLSWLQRSYASLRPDQICKLPSCYRHVFVELHDDGSSDVYDFCGWKHCQQFNIASALPSFGETSVGHEPSVESLMESLKGYVRDKSILPRNVEVDEDFFNNHPWDVLNLPGVESRWLIVRCKWKETDNSKRELITKHDYHWKQQGKTSSYTNEICKRYLTYTKLGSKKRASNESNEMPFTMLEYTLVGADEFKDYSLVKLSRGRVPPNRARKRANLDNENQTEDVETFLQTPEHELPTVHGGKETEIHRDLPDYDTLDFNWDFELDDLPKL